MFERPTTLTKNKLASHFTSHFPLRHNFKLEILPLRNFFCSSKVYYSNARYDFCMNSALLPLRATLHLRKNSA